MMRIFYAALFASALILPLPVHATSPTRMTMSVQVTGRMSRLIRLRTEKLRERAWRASWLAYGRVISTRSLMATARTVIDARQSVVAMRTRSATAEAEYLRLRNLYSRRANVSHRQVQRARSRSQSDHAALRRAQMNFMTARSTARVKWGPLLSRWLTEDSRHLNQFAAGAARVVGLTLPGRTQITAPKGAVTLVTIDGARIPATWISVAPTSGRGLQGVAFFVWTVRDTARLPYNTGVVARIPHGPLMHGVVVPRTAVIWSGSSAWVFVQTGKRAYRREPVSTRYPAGDGWFESSAPMPGEVIVTHGAQVLLSVQQLGTSSSSPHGGDHD